MLTIVLPQKIKYYHFTLNVLLQSAFGSVAEMVICLVEQLINSHFGVRVVCFYIIS